MLQESLKRQPISLWSPDRTGQGTGEPIPVMPVLRPCMCRQSMVHWCSLRSSGRAPGTRATGTSQPRPTPNPTREHAPDIFFSCFADTIPVYSAQSDKEFIDSRKASIFAYGQRRYPHRERDLVSGCAARLHYENVDILFSLFGMLLLRCLT